MSKRSKAQIPDYSRKAPATQSSKDATPLKTQVQAPTVRVIKPRSTNAKSGRRGG